MGANIQRNVLWSDSLTKEYLTTYAEGLACVNFDNRLKFDVRRHDETSWYVLKKESGPGLKHNPAIDNSSSIRFDRVRRVYIDPEGYMSCTCGYVQRHLMPCVHMCAVIGKKEYYVPSMFHLRWFKCFNYYYGQKFAADIAPATLAALERLLQDTRASQYHEHSGIYKGVNMKDSPFINTIAKFQNLNTADAINDCVMSNMQFIVQHTVTTGPVVSGKHDSFHNTVHNRVHDNHTDEDNDFYPECTLATTSYDNNCLSIISLSQAEVSLSQARKDICDEPISEENAVMSFAYRDALPCFEEWFNSCRSLEQYNRLRKIMSEEHFKNIAQNRQRVDTHDSSNTLFGSHPTTKKRLKRKKFKHERY